MVEVEEKLKLNEFFRSANVFLSLLLLLRRLSPFLITTLSPPVPTNSVSPPAFCSRLFSRRVSSSPFFFFFLEKSTPSPLKKSKMALSSKEADIAMLLAAQCHLGTKNLHPACERYVHSRRSDGIHVINVAKTWDKLQLAARIIVAIENPADIAVLSSRPFGQRAALKFAHYTGAKALAGRHTPGEY